MSVTAAQYEAGKILAELPDRISEVIKPFVRHNPEHPALVQGDVTWTYAELAAVATSLMSLCIFSARTTMATKFSGHCEERSDEAIPIC